MTNWLEEVWEHREKVVYRKLFGDPEGNWIYPLKPVCFSRFGDQALDPRWLHHGVFAFPPTERRPSWAYVTSGMSNAWEDTEPNPKGTSGLGSEFLFETSARHLWAIGQLQEIMAFQLLLAAGRFPGKPLLGAYDRIPLHDSIEPAGTSELRFLMLCPAEEDYPEQLLDSGSFGFLRLVGITESEKAFAKSEGGESLLRRLRAAGAYPVTKPERAAVV